MATSAVKQNKLNLQMREILGQAYAFIRGREYTKSVANVTYEQLLDAAIHRIEGTEGRSEVRGTILDRIQKIKLEIGAAVDTVKKRPPHEWVIESDDRSSKEDLANTTET